MSFVVRFKLRKLFPFFFIIIFAGRVTLFALRFSHTSVQLTSATDMLIPLPPGAVGLLQLNEVSNKIKKEHVRTKVFITVPFNKYPTNPQGRKIIPGNNYRFAR